MGIRVDESALRLQVGLTGDEDHLKWIGTKIY